MFWDKDTSISVGIDLGTSYSCVGYYRDEKVEIITNEQGQFTTPSYIAFTEEDRFVGDSALEQVLTNPTNTIYDVKRLIGRKFLCFTTRTCRMICNYGLLESRVVLAKNLSSWSSLKDKQRDFNLRSFQP